MTRTVGFVAAAVAGGGIALGGAALLGGIGGNTTTVREVDAAAPAESAAFAGGPSSNALSVHEIYQRSAPGVVQVTTTSVVQTAPDPFTNPFGLPQQQETQALGSGFVIDKAGHLITNFHVVQNAKSVEVSFSNNESMKASIVGSDPSTDIAVLQVRAPSRALTPLPLGNSDSVRVGDSVVAIGNPFGLDRSATSGIVSALQRQIQAPNRFSIDHAIQTDAAINHGNSGGPLISAEGTVIGVNAQIQTGGTTDGNVGVGFAIPINTVKAVAAQLIKHGRVEHAFIGVTAQVLTPELARLFRLPVERGLLVRQVEPGSGAAKAGVRGGKTTVVVAGESYSLGGDVIVEADGVAVSSTSRLRTLVAQKQPGDKMKIVVYRGSKKLPLDVKLGRQPDSLPG